jgi:hypothetical protein
MFTSPELVTLIQQERERSIARDRLARLAACVRSCCDPSLVGRVARAFRRSPAAC